MVLSRSTLLTYVSLVSVSFGIEDCPSKKFTLRTFAYSEKWILKIPAVNNGEEEN